MAMTEKIKITLIKRNMTVVDLSKKLGCSSTNIYNKLKRDNFSEKELNEIAEVLDCEFVGGFKMKGTNEII